MNVQQPKQQKGFTIIEVILVLAIAGLIFLMVFLALPALQRGQRDTQRKTDLSRVLTAVQNYQSNNRNTVPTTNAAVNTLQNDYLEVGGDAFADPSGDDYDVYLSTGGAVRGEVGDGSIAYTTGAVCGTDGALNTTNQGASKIAVRMKLEGGGVACESN